MLFYSKKTACWSKSHEASSKATFVIHLGCGMGRRLWGRLHIQSRPLWSRLSRSLRDYIPNSMIIEFTKIMLKTAKKQEKLHEICNIMPQRSTQTTPSALILHVKTPPDAFYPSHTQDGSQNWISVLPRVIWPKMLFFGVK